MAYVYKRPPCSEPRCTEPVVARRLCTQHYANALAEGRFDRAPRPRRADGSRPATICPPDHKHDANTVCYIQHKCRCTPCRKDHAARETRRAKLKAYGRFDRGVVDAQPVREHMMMLAAHGIGYKRAAELAGIGVTAARTLLWGRQDPGPRNGELQKHVKRQTAEAILRVTPTLDNLAGGVTVPARATVRRLQALVALGYSMSFLGEQLGMGGGNLGSLFARYDRARSKKTVTVTARRARDTRELYERLASTTPRATSRGVAAAIERTRRYAAERGWPLPMDWAAADDDFDRDRPPARSASRTAA